MGFFKGNVSIIPTEEKLKITNDKNFG